MAGRYTEGWGRKLLACGPASIVCYFISGTPSRRSEPDDGPLKQRDRTWRRANYESSVVSCPCGAGVTWPGRHRSAVPFGNGRGQVGRARSAFPLLTYLAEVAGTAVGAERAVVCLNKTRSARAGAENNSFAVVKSRGKVVGGGEAEGEKSCSYCKYLWKGLYEQRNLFPPSARVWGETLLSPVFAGRYRCV